MKKTTLKSLIEGIIRKTIIEKLVKEGQPIGGVKNDHDFDAGRQGVMKAVNIAEDYEDKKIYKDRQGGEDVYWIDNKDTGGKMRIRPESVRRYIQKGYRIIDLQMEKVGFDGKYVDDMESGVAVKKLHKLDEDDDRIAGKFVDRGQVKLEGGLDYNSAEKIANSQWDIFGSSGKDERGVWNFKTRGDRWCCSVGMLNGQPAMLSVTTTPGRLHLLVGKELTPSVKEQSSSGAAGGYQTPFAFSKKKSGSKRAMDVTTRMGFKKVKDIS